MIINEEYVKQQVIPVLKTEYLPTLNRIVSYLKEVDSITHEEAEILFELVDELENDINSYLHESLQLEETHVLTEAKKKPKTTKSPVKKMVNKFVINPIKKRIETTKNYITTKSAKAVKQARKMKKYAVANKGKTALMATAAATAGYGAGKFYQRFLSKAGRMCAGKKGPERTECIKMMRERIKNAKAEYKKKYGNL